MWPSGLIALALVSLGAGISSAQTLSARRVAMGGVILSGGGPGSDAPNVAYRAVPPAPDEAPGFALPLGLIPFLADFPELDPDDPDFNLFEIANAFYNPPWNLQLVEPEAPSNDITISVGRNSLAVDLGDIKDVLPDAESESGAVMGFTPLAIENQGFFLGLLSLVHYENELRLNDPLRRALVEGEPFETRTQYALFDDVETQAAAGLQIGWAGAALSRGEHPRTPGAHALYAGARIKVLRGIAYGVARNTVTFATGDTLFAANPVDILYLGEVRDAGPDDGRSGRGLDLGLVWVSDDLEIGLGVNDIATRIHWLVEESVVFKDPITGDYVEDILQRGVKFRSQVPTTVAANTAIRIGPTLIAADIKSEVRSVVAHLGAELWLGRYAVRAGGNLDERQRVQFATGGGVRFGRLGVDVALATHNRNVSQKRGLELAAGLSFYR